MTTADRKPGLLHMKRTHNDVVSSVPFNESFSIKVIQIDHARKIDEGKAEGEQRD
jgi:hypothetical protein